MFNENNFIHFPHGSLHYAKGGEGAAVLLLFHGFGQDHHVFDELLTTLQYKFTLYSFDLFFHGKSEWNENAPLEKNVWKELMASFFKKEHIERFAVAGYSLGGKFALTTLELFPGKIDKMYLLAPDGITPSAWYWLATGPALTRRLFHSMIVRPGRFQDVVRLLGGLGIVNNGVLRFAASQMDTESKRRRVYNSWVVFRHLHSNMQEVANILNSKNIPVEFILGSFDKMIPAPAMDKLIKKIHLKKINIIHAGHNAIIHGSPPFFL